MVRQLLKIIGKAYPARSRRPDQPDAPMPQLFQLFVLCMPWPASRSARRSPCVPGHRVVQRRPAEHQGGPGCRSARDDGRFQPGALHALRRGDWLPTHPRSLSGFSTILGDLREIAGAVDSDIATAKRMLKQFKGIGDTGADIYLREVQDVWTSVRPYFDERAARAAKALGLPTDPANSVRSPRIADARLAAALMRASRSMTQRSWPARPYSSSSAADLLEPRR